MVIPKDVLLTLQCPIDFLPLTTAVTLSTCMHKINEGPAKAIFGSIKNGRLDCIKPCPVCQQPVTAYYVDHTLRALAQTIFDFDKKIPTKEVANSPYLEVPTKFYVYKNEWTKHSFTLGGYFKVIILSSMVPNTTLDSVFFSGENEGSLKLHVNFEDSRAIDYFIKQGLPDAIIDNFSITAKKIIHIRKLFDIITKNNEFPENELKIMRQVIQAGRWK